MQMLCTQPCALHLLVSGLKHLLLTPGSALCTLQISSPSSCPKDREAELLFLLAVIAEPRASSHTEELPPQPAGQILPGKCNHFQRAEKQFRRELCG